MLEYNERVHQLFIDFKKAYDSVRGEVFDNVLPVWGTHETNLMVLLSDNCTGSKSTKCTCNRQVLEKAMSMLTFLIVIRSLLIQISQKFMELLKSQTAPGYPFCSCPEEERGPPLFCGLQETNVQRLFPTAPD
jgi:hypothetical protein